MKQRSPTEVHSCALDGTGYAFSPVNAEEIHAVNLAALAVKDVLAWLKSNIFPGTPAHFKQA